MSLLSCDWIHRGSGLDLREGEGEDYVLELRLVKKKDRQLQLVEERSRGI